MTENKLIYIASPYAGDIVANVAFAKAACLYAMEQGHTPIAVHLHYPQFLDDSNPAQRSAGLTMGHRVLEACDELWVCGERISNGMAGEIAEAKRLGIPVVRVATEQIYGEVMAQECVGFSMQL